MSRFALLAIDFGDLVGVLIFVVFVVLSVLNQFITKWREQAQKRPGQPRANRGGAPAGKPQKDPAKEVEEFLRRVAQMGREEEPARETPVEVVEQRRPKRQTNQQRPQPKQQQPQRPKKPKQQRSGERLQERHLDSQVGDRHITSRVEQADERVEAQVQQHLDTIRGSLPVDQMTAGAPQGAMSDAPTVVLPARLDRGAPRGANLAALLANRDNVRQAIVLNEILRRPEERWD